MKEKKHPFKRFSFRKVYIDYCERCDRPLGWKHNFGLCRECKNLGKQESFNEADPDCLKRFLQDLE